MLKITGNTKVFVHEKSYTNEKGVALTRNSYTTSVSKKNTEGEYINAYLDVQFSKNATEVLGLDVLGEGDSFDINIIDGWPTCWGYDTKDEKKRFIQIFVNDAEFYEAEAFEEEAPKKKPASKSVSKATPKKPLKK